MKSDCNVSPNLYNLAAYHKRLVFPLFYRIYGSLNQKGMSTLRLNLGNMSLFIDENMKDNITGNVCNFCHVRISGLYLLNQLSLDLFFIEQNFSGNRCSRRGHYSNLEFGWFTLA